MLRKVVINVCHGGFGLSKEAAELYCAKTNTDKGEWVSSIGYYSKFYAGELDRDDPVLIEVVEQLGDKANGRFAELKIVEIPADIEWSVHEYDGAEWVAEAHRTWS